MRHSGSVPVSHSLRAFNAVAAGHRSTEDMVRDPEIEQLVKNRKLTAAEAAPREIAGLDREIVLHRQSKDSEVIIFDGGHESLPEAAIAWLSLKRRATHRESSASE